MIVIVVTMDMITTGNHCTAIHVSVLIQLSKLGLMDATMLGIRF